MSITNTNSLKHPRLRVLIVDDSVVVRNVVSMALKDDPYLEVVGMASNGEIALAKIPQLNPDVITLDIEMPEMNGLEMLKHVRAKYPKIFIIMFSTLSTPGAAATLDALMLGANDYVPKPSNCGSLEKSVAILKEELVPKIRQFYRLPDKSADHAAPPSTIPSPRPYQATLVRPRVLTIGVSTGGPNVLSAMMPMFPADFPYPVLIVQHMPQVFTRFLAERLQKLTPLRVEEAAAGSRVENGKVLIAPGGFHMKVVQGGHQVYVVLDQSEPRNSCRPSVDVLFESVRDVYGGGVVGMVLTGMGQDGLRGAQILKSAGACIIAQDEATSVVWGMPGFVVRAGLADAVVPLNDLVPVMLDRFGYRARSAGARRLG